MNTFRSVVPVPGNTSELSRYRSTALLAARTGPNSASGTSSLGTELDTRGLSISKWPLLWYSGRAGLSARLGGIVGSNRRKDSEITGLKVRNDRSAVQE